MGTGVSAMVVTREERDRDCDKDVVRQKMAEVGIGVRRKGDWGNRE